MKSYIIDDEPYAIDTLAAYVSKSADLTLAGSSTDSHAGLKNIQECADIEIVFLDINMPGLSGIELVDLLPDSVSIIFTSAHSKYAIDGYDLEVGDFLLKPISFARFLKAVDKVKQKRLRPQSLKPSIVNSFFINPGAKGKVVKVLLNTIVYVEGLKNYVIIHTTDRKSIIAYLTMNEIHESLTTNDFSRIHKSFIINNNKIESIEGNRVKMEQLVEVPIGSNYKDAFMEVIAGRTIKSKRSGI